MIQEQFLTNSKGEDKVFFMKMLGDFYRYLLETNIDKEEEQTNIDQAQ